MSFSDEQIVEKIASIGISLGSDSSKIGSSINNLKTLELGRLKNKGLVDVEEMEDENLDCNDISVLNHFCSDLDDMLEDDHSNFTVVTNRKSSKNKTFRNRPIKLKVK